MYRDPEFTSIQDAMTARHGFPLCPEWLFEHNGITYSAEAPTWQLALAHIAEANDIPLSAINPDDWELLNVGSEQVKPRGEAQKLLA